MAIWLVNIRDKGQMTLPVNIREELGLKKGDKLLVERRGKEIVLISPDDVVDPTAGALAEYAYTSNPDPAEERRWVAKRIAETADSYE